MQRPLRCVFLLVDFWPKIDLDRLECLTDFNLSRIKFNKTKRFINVFDINIKESEMLFFRLMTHG